MYLIYILFEYAFLWNEKCLAVKFERVSRKFVKRTHYREMMP